MPRLWPTSSSSGSSPSITARYFSSYPSDSTSRWTPCPPEDRRLVASGPPWLVSAFRFRARLGFVIPSTFSGPRGVTPAFGYGAPHSGARGTLTLLNSALLSAHYGASPPLCSASVLSALRFRRLHFPFPSERQVPMFLTKPEGHAAFMPDAGWPVSRSPPSFSRVELLPVSMPIEHFDTSSVVHSRSSPSSPPDVNRPPFNHNVHHRGSLPLAACGSLKPAPTGRLEGSTFISRTA